MTLICNPSPIPHYPKCTTSLMLLCSALKYRNNWTNHITFFACCTTVGAKTIHHLVNKVTLLFLQCLCFVIHIPWKPQISGLSLTAWGFWCGMIMVAPIWKSYISLSQRRPGCFLQQCSDPCFLPTTHTPPPLSLLLMQKPGSFFSWLCSPWPLQMNLVNPPTGRVY